MNGFLAGIGGAIQLNEAVMLLMRARFFMGTAVYRKYIAMLLFQTYKDCQSFLVMT